MTSPDSPPQSRSSLWFFLVLAVLSGVAMVVPILYNLSIQLTPQQVTDARHLWHEHAPADYDLAYLIKTSQGDRVEDNQYLVKVRNGRILLVVSNDRVVFAEPSLALVAGPAFLAAPLENPEPFGVLALFDKIEDSLNRDGSTGQRRDFATASFDPKDGHPFHYVHRVRGTKERVEWNIKMTRPISDASQKR